MSPLPGSEEEQAAGAMKLIGEEDEEERPSAAGAEVAPESASQATTDLNADQELLDTPRARYTPHSRVDHRIVESPDVDRQSRLYAHGLTHVLQEPRPRTRTREPPVPKELLNVVYCPNTPCKVSTLFISFHLSSMPCPNSYLSQRHRHSLPTRS